MKSLSVIALMAVLVAAMLLGNAMASQQTGPAPNSGDGISDGSGIIPLPKGEGISTGGSPNSGDGVPDGSGW